MNQIFDLQIHYEFHEFCKRTCSVRQALYILISTHVNLLFICIIERMKPRTCIIITKYDANAINETDIQQSR